MRTTLAIAFLVLAGYACASDQSAKHTWLTGKVIDENRARYLAMVHHSGHGTTTTNGTVNATGNSTTIGNNTTTNVNGSYSGTSSTNYSSADVPLYKVYENLVVEGEDMVYVTQERIRWRWSKAAHVTVNGQIRYYVDGSKLHVLDDDDKEHVAQIVQQIRKDKPAAPQPGTAKESTGQATAAPAPAAATAQLQISSTPDGADIEIDGNYVGSTPSTVGAAAGQHQVSIKKSGFKPWERKITVSTGQINVNASLEPESK